MQTAVALVLPSERHQSARLFVSVTCTTTKTRLAEHLEYRIYHNTLLFTFFTFLPSFYPHLSLPQMYHFTPLFGEL
jgi:hypothetical protein